MRSASETVLTNVRVLAIGQITDDQKGKPIVAKTATLEVTPKQAEVVAVAVQLGKLSLSLRALAKSEEEKYQTTPLNPRLHSFTRDSDVSRLIGRKEKAETHTVNVIHGGKAKTQMLRKATR
jgi:pilus assembly protein CpaB